MKLSFKDILKETLNEMFYTTEETQQYRIILATLIDTTLSKPTLDVNTFLDPVEQKDQYEWFRYNPEEYIEAYSDIGGTYGPIRDPKETSLLYYLYKGTYQGKDGKWYIGNGEDIDAVIKEVRDRAMAFVDAIGDYQELIDVFYSDFQKVLKFTDKFAEKTERETAVSSFMSKDSPGEFERMEFAKFRSGPMYGDTTTKGIRGTRDHMYKNSPELKNIPQEHKMFFSFDYMWMTCYNLAQADGLKPSEKQVIKLTGQYYADNYRNGITVEENKKMFGSAPSLKSLKSTDGLSYIHNQFLRSLLNDDEAVLPISDEVKPKPVSEMNDQEIIMYLKDPFSDLLYKTIQSLKLNVYPSMMIDLLRIKEKIPNALIESKKKMYTKIIKAMQIAGYLDENENFTNRVSKFTPQKIKYDNLKNFNLVVEKVANNIEMGLVEQHNIDRMYEIFDKLKGTEKSKAIEILRKYNVNSNTIESATVNFTEKVSEAYDILKQMTIDKGSGKKIDQNKLSQLYAINDLVSDQEEKDIKKIIFHLRKKGVL